jgi:hypothetical protein
MCWLCVLGLLCWLRESLLLIVLQLVVSTVMALLLALERVDLFSSYLDNLCTGLNGPHFA